MADYLRPGEPLIRGPQDDMVQGVLLPVPLERWSSIHADRVGATGLGLLRRCTPLDTQLSFPRKRSNSHNSTANQGPPDLDFESIVE